MKRQVKQISKLPPLQRDTAMIVPNSTIKGGSFDAVDVVGNNFSSIIKIERVNDKLPVLDTNLRFVATAASKFTITNVDTGYVTAEQDASSADVTVVDFAGIKITIASADASKFVADDICDISVIGDSTYIVPGTILGRIKDENSQYHGWYEPIGSDLTQYDILRVCGGTIETNKANLVAAASDIMNNDNKYTVDVYVFGQVYKHVCSEINLTDDAEKMIQGIVWE